MSKLTLSQYVDLTKEESEHYCGLCFERVPTPGSPKRKTGSHIVPNALYEDSVAAARGNIYDPVRQVAVSPKKQVAENFFLCKAAKGAKAVRDCEKFVLGPFEDALIAFCRGENVDAAKVVGGVLSVVYRAILDMRFQQSLFTLLSMLEAARNSFFRNKPCQLFTCALQLPFANDTISYRVDKVNGHPLFELSVCGITFYIAASDFFQSFTPLRRAVALSSMNGTVNRRLLTTVTMLANPLAVIFPMFRDVPHCGVAFRGPAVCYDSYNEPSTLEFFANKRNRVLSGAVQRVLQPLERIPHFDLPHGTLLPFPAKGWEFQHHGGRVVLLQKGKSYSARDMMSECVGPFSVVKGPSTTIEHVRFIDSAQSEAPLCKRLYCVVERSTGALVYAMLSLLSSSGVVELAFATPFDLDGRVPCPSGRGQGKCDGNCLFEFHSAAAMSRVVIDSDIGHVSLRNYARYFARKIKRAGAREALPEPPAIVLPAAPQHHGDDDDDGGGKQKVGLITIDE